TALFPLCLGDKPCVSAVSALSPLNAPEESFGQVQVFNYCKLPLQAKSLKFRPLVSRLQCFQVSSISQIPLSPGFYPGFSFPLYIFLWVRLLRLTAPDTWHLYSLSAIHF